MNPDSIDWDEDLPPASPEEEYQALRRAIQRTDGFGLIFAQCAPAKGHEIIEQIKEDLPQKKVEVLSLKEPIRNLYERVEALLNRNKIDVLFIEGLEYSIYEYEDAKRHLGWTTEEIQSYSWKGVPHILTNLNQQRERFRDNFSICFVFLVPLFVLKYLTYRAPDFFDWRSGVFQFRMNENQIRNEIQHISINSGREQYSQLTPQKRAEKIFRIQTLVEESQDASSGLDNLYVELAVLFASEHNWQAAAANLNKALKIKPDNFILWYFRGETLAHLGQYENATVSYDKSLEIQPNNHDILNNLGVNIWESRGNALGKLERYEEAIASYDKALEIQPDNNSIWIKQGFALSNLGRYKEAVAIYDRILKFEPDNHDIWQDRGFALYFAKSYEEAITSYDKVLEFEPDNCDIWKIRGISLVKSGRYKEAIASYNKALEFEPDDNFIWYAKARAHALQKEIELTLQSLHQAITLNPDQDQYREFAKNNSDFDGIRDDPRFQALISNPQTFISPPASLLS